MNYLNIPVELCKYALTHRKTAQLRLYVFLKVKCSGHMKLSEYQIEEFSHDLNIKSHKTFNSHLNWLLQEEWITYNSKSGNYRIKGFNELSKKLKFTSVTGAIFKIKDFKKFKAFCAAAVITYYMNYKSRIEKQSEFKKMCSRKNCFSPASFSLPHTYLAKVLNTSKSNAAIYRKLAIISGYIKAFKRYTLTLKIFKRNRTKRK